MADYKIKLMIDTDPQEPDGDGRWTLYQFDSRRSNYNPRKDWIGEGKTGEVPAGPGTRSKLRAGLAFWIGERWEEFVILDGINPPARTDGIIVWENKPTEMGAKTRENRRKDAQGQLDEYNDWAMGRVFGYVKQDADGSNEDSCWGFCGTSHMLKDLGLVAGDRVRVSGDAADHFGTGDWPAGVEVFANLVDLPGDWGQEAEFAKLAVACGTL